MSTVNGQPTRANVGLTGRLSKDVEAAAADLDMSVPDYIRRALAFTLRLDQYMHDGELVVLDPERDKEIHLQLIS